MEQSPGFPEGAPDELADRVRALVARELSMRLDWVKMSSRLEEDFGVSGDDAAELLEVFAMEFKVDLAGIDFHRHFGPESGFPGWMLPPPVGHPEHGRYPVTVDHLVHVAELGRWVSPPRV